MKPFDGALLARQREAGMLIASIENGSVVGGFGETIGADMRFGWPDAFIPHGSAEELERAYSLDADSIAAAIDICYNSSGVRRQGVLPVSLSRRRNEQS